MGKVARTVVPAWKFLSKNFSLASEPSPPPGLGRREALPGNGISEAILNDRRRGRLSGIRADQFLRGIVLMDLQVPRVFALGGLLIALGAQPVGGRIHGRTGTDVG